MDPFVTVVAACCLMGAIERDIREDCAAEKAAKPTGPVLPRRGDLSSPARRPEPVDLTPLAVQGAVPPVIETYRRPHMFPGPVVNGHGQELEGRVIRDKVIWRVA